MSNFLHPKLFLTFGTTASVSESHKGGKKENHSKQKIKRQCLFLRKIILVFENSIISPHCKYVVYLECLS